jgi:methylmalonyl-CoA mutase N-terminal domain/subunit
VADVIDPMGGSYAVERLTDELEAKAEDYIRRIDEMGGMVAAIAKGYPQGEIQEAAYQAQRELEAKRTVVVGVNQFQAKEPRPKGLMRVDEAVEQMQVERLKKLKAERDGGATTRAVDALRRAAKQPEENLIPLILDAVKAYATLGEISDAMRDVFGEYRENVVL